MNKITNQLKAPLLPNYPFNEFILAGETFIIQNEDLDFWINRPEGMEGWIINITLEGSGQIFQDNNNFFVHQGDILLFPPGVPHLYGRNSLFQTWCHRWIYFQPSPLWSHLLSYSKQINGVFQTKIFQTKDFQLLCELFSEIIHTIYNNNPQIDLEVNLLEQILIRCSYIDKNQQEIIKDQIVLDAILWVSQNFHTPFTLLDVSNALNCSPSKLVVIFKKHMGMPFMQWAITQRLEYSCKMLKLTDASIKTIALQIGISNQLYFSRLFKKKYNISPSLYRETVKK